MNYFDGVGDLMTCCHCVVDPVNGSVGDPVNRFLLVSS